MRTNHIRATSLAFLLTACFVTSAQAQPAAPPRGTASPVTHHGVAVIDVTFVLDHYARLKTAGEAFKRDVQDAGDKLKKEREAINKRVEELKGLKPGTPDYKKLEEKITQSDSDWKVKASFQEKELAERESQIYLSAYKELSQVVKAYADRNGISLVLRFNGAPPDPNNRDAVRAEMSKMVMYQNGIDITDPVLLELNKNAAVNAATRPAQPGAARPR